MSFRDFFGVRHGGYLPKGDGHDGPKGPSPETGSGVQPPAFVPDAQSSVQIGPVGSVVFGPPEDVGRMMGQRDVGASAFFRAETGQLSPEAVAAQRDSFEKRRAEREAEMKRRERDALIEKAALAILQGSAAHRSDALEVNFASVWLHAERFVDAREAGAKQYQDWLA